MKREIIGIEIPFIGKPEIIFGYAELQRNVLLAKALMEVGYDITFISFKGSKWNNHLSLPPKGLYCGIKYWYTTGNIHEPNGKLKKIITRIKGRYIELMYLYKQARKKAIRYAFISSKDFFNIFVYYIFSRIAGFKLVVNYVEYYAAIKQKKGLRNTLNNYLFDRLTYRFADKILPISTFLENTLKDKKYKKPIFKIPVICDFTRFEKEKDFNSENYFCYCGSFNYKEVIYFVVETFMSIKEKKGFKLYMIVSGKKDNIEDIKDHIKKSFPDSGDFIRIYSNISDEELATIYINAKAMLIPMRNTLQDIARFPHKIGEYAASGNPIITGNIGEVNYYFNDGYNALITNNFDKRDYQSKMEFVIDNPEKAESIGQNGKETGLTHFNYLSYSKPLKKLLSK